MSTQFNESYKWFSSPKLQPRQLFSYLFLDIDTTSVMASQELSEYTDDATRTAETAATPDRTTTDSSQTLSSTQG